MDQNITNQSSSDNERLSNFDRLVIENKKRSTNPDLLSDDIRHEMEELKEENEEESFRFKRIPKNVFIFCIILDILGLIFLTITIRKFKGKFNQNFILLSLLTFLLLVPSIYYTWFCIKIGFIKNRYDRECVIASIPQLN